MYLNIDTRRITIHVEWIDSLFLYHYKYHRFDDLLAKHKHQMRYVAPLYEVCISNHCMLLCNVEVLFWLPFNKRNIHAPNYCAYIKALMAEAQCPYLVFDNNTYHQRYINLFRYLCQFCINNNLKLNWSNGGIEHLIWKYIWLSWEMLVLRVHCLGPHVYLVEGLSHASFKLLHSEKSPARPMLFYSTNYWHHFWVQFVV